LSAHSLLTPRLLTHLCLFRQLNLSNNRLCGVWVEYGTQKGEYNAEGINAIADALRVNDGLTSLDLSGNALCGVSYGGGTYAAEGITAIADALRVNGALTVANLLGNQLDVESAKMLAEVAKQKGISLCGIQHDQTTADFSKQSLELPDAILLASDLSQAVVTGALTALNLSFNSLRDEGVNAVCEAIKSNKEIKLASLNFEDNGIGPVGAKSVAAMVAVTGALTSLDLSNNSLCGVNAYGGTYTAKGITAIADALRVNGGLTVANLLRNQLDAESAKMLAEVAKQKGISLSAAFSGNRPPLTSPSRTSSRPMLSCWRRTCHRPLSQAR
jgi:hypothetical protein